MKGIASLENFKRSIGKKWTECFIYFNAFMNVFLISTAINFNFVCRLLVLVSSF